MRCCARIPEWARPQAVVLLLLLGGCSEAETDFGITLDRVTALRSANVIEVVVHQNIVLSGQAREALTHGVPLFIQTNLSLRNRDSRQDIWQTIQEHEIRYLPLSKRYELVTSQPFSVRSFPRLRYALAEIAVLKFSLPAEQFGGDQFDLRARTFLEKRNMPPPMRLPAWLSAQWRHDSGWQTWPISLGDRA